MNYLSKLFLLTVLSISFIQNVQAKDSTENYINKEINILKIKISDGIKGWDIYDKAKKTPEESNTLEHKNNEDIESWDIWENGEKNLDGYLWLINLKSGPFPTKENAEQAGIELLKKIRNTITSLPKDISIRQTLNPTGFNSPNTGNFSWNINFRLGSYKSKNNAQEIVQKLKANPTLPKNVFLTREPIDIKVFTSAEITQAKIKGELFLTRETKSIKDNIQHSIIVSTKGNSLNVRNKPSSSSPKIGSLLNGSKVPHIKNHIDTIDNDSWFYVEYLTGKFGWISGKYSKKFKESGSIISQQDTVKTTNNNKAQAKKKLNKDIAQNFKKKIVRNQIETKKRKVYSPKTKAKETPSIEELKRLNEINLRHIADLQKTNATLLFKNESRSQLVADLKRTNTILRMEKNFNSSKLQELKAKTALTQKKLDKIKSDYYSLKGETPKNVRKLRTLNKIDSNQVTGLQKTIEYLRSEEKLKTSNSGEFKATTTLTKTKPDKKKTKISQLKKKEQTNIKELKTLSENKSEPVKENHKTNATLSSSFSNNPETLITPKLISWINAWQSQNIPLYLSFYSTEFKDPKRSYSKWKAQRRRSLKNSSNIAIKTTDIKAQISNKIFIKVTFIQRYISDTVSDTGIKEMIWKKEESNWKIIKETWKPK